MTEDKHNKHVCKCDECIKIRMAKALEKIEEKAEAEGKIPMRVLCYKSTNDRNDYKRSIKNSILASVSTQTVEWDE